MKNRNLAIYPFLYVKLVIKDTLYFGDISLWPVIRFWLRHRVPFILIVIALSSKVIKMPQSSTTALIKVLLVLRLVRYQLIALHLTSQSISRRLPCY